jgi:hypothetical protein
MNNSSPSEIILSVLSGNASLLQMLKRQDEIERVGKEIPENKLAVVSSAVRRVLTALLRKEITSGQAQAWASFVRRGFIPTDQKLLKPLPIFYQQECEDDIAEAISRMDELGDIIDGTMDDDEIRELIQKLERCEKDKN